MMVTSHFSLEVELWLFCTCAMKNVQSKPYCGWTAEIFAS